MRQRHDPMTEKGANEIAARIRAYWAERGHVVEAVAVQIGQSDKWAVRSDLVNGMPKGAKT